MSEPSNTIANGTPVLILLHGATINGHMWDPVKRLLHPGYHVMTPDLPGHGSRRNEPYTVAGAVETVAAAARSVADSPVVVAGDSLGGYTSIAAASALPRDQLKGLVLGGSSFNFVGSEVWPYKLRAMLFNTLCAVFSEQKLIEKSVAKSMGEGAGKIGIPAEDVRAMVNAGMSMRVFGQCVSALQGLDFQAMVANIEQPILFVNGDKDKPNIRHEASFLAVAKQANSHRFENCEHGVSIRRYKEFAALLNGFAAQVLPRSVPQTRAAAGQ